ncbi:DMT family transporter [Fusibacter bizertensis]|uniref:DMT family transporter n=1 Tax=Fusibacter bizertensis TaxID=1488331 RepID=A0ABT6N8J4_9FIRM|nr:DMT family transporter [Fusibacter bizertensis]MDH8676739.1 DMT family transporter [Fusibacter bizertensis]
MKTNGRIFAIVCVVLASLLWSTGGLLIKMVSWHPIAISGMRSGISSLVMLILYFSVYKRLPRRPNKYVLMGAINYMFLVMLFVSANKLTTSANAILLQFTAPAWAMVIGAFFLKEKFSKKDVSTVIIVFLGMLLFFVGDLKSGSLIGNTLAVVSGISMALMIISLKRIQGRKPIEIVIWGNILTFFIAIPFYSGITLTSANIIGVLLLGVFQLGLSYIFFTKGIENVSVLEGILIPVLEPLLNPFWVFLGTGEKPSVFAFIGGVIVLSAVVYHSIIEVKEK